jgi:hypothetical protein
MVKDLAKFLREKPNYCLYDGQDSLGTVNKCTATSMTIDNDSAVSAAATADQAAGRSVEADPNATAPPAAMNGHDNGLRTGRALLDTRSGGMERAISDSEDGHDAETVLDMSVCSECSIRSSDMHDSDSGGGCLKLSTAAATADADTKTGTSKDLRLLNGREITGDRWVQQLDTKEMICEPGWWNDQQYSTSDTFLSADSLEAALAASALVCKASFFFLFCSRSCLPSFVLSCRLSIHLIQLPIIHHYLFFTLFTLLTLFTIYSIVYITGGGRSSAWEIRRLSVRARGP